MTTERYNGWTNYETWNWKLWLDNDHGTYLHWQDETQHICTEATDRDDAVDTLMERLKDDCEVNVPESVCGSYADMLSAAIGEINFHEIAESMIDDADYEFATEEETVEAE